MPTAVFMGTCSGCIDRIGVATTADALDSIPAVKVPLVAKPDRTTTPPKGFVGEKLATLGIILR